MVSFSSLSTLLPSPRRGALVSVLFVLGGCSITPNELTLNELQEAIESDRQAATVDQIAPDSVLSLEEAVARALKYNLDQRAKSLEVSLAAGQLQAGKYDMLPRLLANAGYDWRDNYNLRYQATPESPKDFDKNQPLELSQDSEHYSSDLTLSWNLLDFGASYYTAKQNADRLLIAKERRRKAMHTLVQNVRVSYWRAVAAEMLSEQVKQAIAKAEQALSDSEQVSQRRVKAPEESLRYQRNLLENLRLLESIERELASARIRLANLMALDPGTPFTLVEPSSDLPLLDTNIQELEVIALSRNADLREQRYNSRIAAADTRKALLKLLPGITMSYGSHYDDDYYLVNENWDQAALKVSFNLFNLIAGPSKMRAARSQESLEDARRVALQMTVVTQLHLARHQYRDALRQYRRADHIYRVDSQLADIMQAKFASKMVGEQSQIAADVTSIFSQLRRYQAMAKAQEAIGQLQTTLGIEPEFDSTDEFSLPAMSEAVKQWLDKGISIQHDEATEHASTS